MLLRELARSVQRRFHEVRDLPVLHVLFYHAWIGVRDIFMDYIKPTGVRLVLHSVVVLLLIGYAGWAAQILWRL
jgi:succinate dehydrogenase hydrophobic membrane anchor protein